MPRRKRTFSPLWLSRDAPPKHLRSTRAASRKPAEVLSFMGLQKGMKTLDLLTGTGY